MANPFLQVSGDAQRALEEFSLEFASALAAAPADTWAQTYGLAKTSRAIKTTYPIPVSAAGYVLAKGDFQMRSLFERSLTMQTREWVDGVSEKAAVIEAPDFIDWGGEPGRIALEGARQPNRIIADMLAANPNLSFYADENLGITSSTPLFSDSHPVNVFDSSKGTFDNNHTAAALDAAMLRAAILRFRQKKAPNGQVAGRRITHMIVPAALEETARDLLESDLMYNVLLDTGSNTNAVSNNRYKGYLNLVVGDELTQDDRIFLLDARGPKPWIVQTSGTPEEIRFDKTSDYYKQTLKVGVKYILRLDGKACLPHAIERVQITG
jgi:hypothetical protein